MNLPYLACAGKVHKTGILISIGRAGSLEAAAALVMYTRWTLSLPVLLVSAGQSMGEEVGFALIGKAELLPILHGKRAADPNLVPTHKLSSDKYEQPQGTCEALLGTGTGIGT
jgi:hypothetical protein